MSANHAITKPLPSPQSKVDWPWKFSRKDWSQILRRVAKEVGNDNVAVVAAGVAFFSLLAIFPLITAGLSIYGYFADTRDIQVLLNEVSAVLPPEAWQLLNTQISAVAEQPNASLGIGIAVGLLFALYSAGAGIRAIMRAMNIAYGEVESRGIGKFYALAAGFTIAMIAFLWIALCVIVVIPATLHFLNLGDAAALSARALPWLLLVFVFGFASGVLYRFGPSRSPAKKRWVLPGIIFTTLAWMVLSAGFSIFVASFGRYNATYGSLSAVIVLLIWFWLTAYVVILGAELNAEMERQTSSDTTRGPDRPAGERGAVVADFTTRAPQVDPAKIGGVDAQNPNIV